MRLKSVEQFQEAKSEARRTCDRLVSNAPFGNAWVQEAIDLGAEIEAFDEGFIVLVDEGPFLRLHYFLAPAADLPDLDVEKPVVIDEPDANGRRQEYLAGWLSRLEEQGWELVERSLQVSLDLDADADRLRKEYDEALARTASEGIQIGPCRNERDAQRVLDLWDDYLKLADVPASHRDFWEDDSQFVVCAYEGDALCGTNWWKVAGRRCEERHIVIDGSYQKKGIGSALLLHSIIAALDAGSATISTYISDQNKASLALFEKVGFKPTGCTTTQYCYAAKGN